VGLQQLGGDFTVGPADGSYEAGKSEMNHQTLRFFNFLLVVALLGCLPLFAEDKAAVDEWKKDMQQAKNAWEKNQFGQAKSFYEAALVQAEKFGPDDARLSETLNKLARILSQLDESPDASAALRRALAMDEKRLGTNDIRLAGELLDLGALSSYSHRYEEAEGYYLRAQSLAESKYGHFDRMVGVCILQRANAAMMEDRLEDSEKLFKQALELIESDRTKFNFAINQYASRSVLLPNKTQVAVALNDMGLLYTKEKKYDDAEASFNRSLKIFESEYGKNSLNLCNGLYNLAVLHVQQGKLAEAEGLLRRSLSILKPTDSDHPLAIQTRQLLDKILQPKNKPAQSPPAQN
jgi:tetratricopeptide (TPR) repeat protein